ncbi:GDSL-type esterase/lipase family protein [Cytobacillus sp. FSL R5-0596]|uniref:GDSL-type esterase/lipase family protein n=1 Tax=Cytobacillus sp. FSL R5-0596 TaxID=2954696 RepID=UPI0030F9669A
MPSYSRNYGFYLPSRADELPLDSTLTESFNKIDEELKNSADTAKDAVVSAESAQKQVSLIVRRETDSDAESVQARVRKDGTVALTLKQRLDDMEEISKTFPVKEVQSPTTPNRSWSTSTNELQHKLNGQEVIFKTAPKGVIRRLAVLGSSTSEGFYAESGNSWFDKLREVLTPMGWEVMLRGLSGDNTTGAINRFHKDVVPYRPDVVIIAFTLGNEGLTADQTQADKEATYNQFKENILTLAMLCKQNGITPVIADQAPTKRYNAEIYQMASQLNWEMDNLGFMTINFKGAIDSLTTSGVPLNAAMYDDLHPNDAGHNAIFRSINPTLFKYLAGTPNIPVIESKKGAIKTPDTITDTEIPIKFTPAHPIETFTVFFRLKALATRTDQRTWAGIGDNGLRISNQATDAFLDLRGNGLSPALISTVNMNDLKEHSVCVTFNKISKVVRFYVDGNFVGSQTVEDINFTEVTLAGRVAGVIGNNTEYRDLAVYRARLSDSQVKDLHKGNYPKGSLELFSPMNDSIVSVNTRLANLAPTDSYAVVQTNSLTSV